MSFVVIPAACKRISPHAVNVMFDGIVNMTLLPFRSVVVFMPESARTTKAAGGVEPEKSRRSLFFPNCL